MDQVGDLATKCPTDKRPHQSGDRLHCATHTLPYSPSATPLGCRLRSLCFRSNTLAILNGCPSQWYWRHVISLQGSSAGACFARVGSALLSFRRISQISGNPDRNGFRNGFRNGLVENWEDGWTMLDLLATLKTPRRKVSLRCMRHPWCSIPIWAPNAQLKNRKI